MAVIRAQGVAKRYGRGGRAVQALAQVDLQVPEGAALGLLGANGAGKTTLVKILAGLLRPDEGRLEVLGHDVLRHPERVRAQVSLVAPTADVGIDNNLTVRQNLEFWAPIYGLRGPQSRRRIAELLETLGLGARADFWPMHLSAGDRQRLALARALLAQNRLVFLDEPTGKLDGEGVRAVRGLVRDLNLRLGVSIVLTTHMMEEAEELCSHLVLLQGGRVVRSGTVEGLLRDAAPLRRIRLKVRAPGADPPGTPLLPAVARWRAQEAGNGEYAIELSSWDVRRTTPALLAWLRAEGLRIRSMETERARVEDLYRAVLGQGG